MEPVYEELSSRLLLICNITHAGTTRAKYSACGFIGKFDVIKYINHRQKFKLIDEKMALVYDQLATASSSIPYIKCILVNLGHSHNLLNPQNQLVVGAPDDDLLKISLYLYLSSAALWVVAKQV